jgi:hypothetical protein
MHYEGNNNKQVKNPRLKVEKSSSKEINRSEIQDKRPETLSRQPKASREAVAPDRSTYKNKRTNKY